MGGILGPLIVEKLDDGRLWRVVEPFRYYLAWPVGGPEAWFVDIPANLITDFASVPRAAWAIVNPVGKIGKPAVVHDKLYTAPVVHNERTSRAITRAEADRILHDAMVSVGVPGWERGLVGSLLSAFGGAAWDRHRAEDAAKV